MRERIFSKLSVRDKT